MTKTAWLDAKKNKMHGFTIKRLSGRGEKVDSKKFWKHSTNHERREVTKVLRMSQFDEVQKSRGPRRARRGNVRS